MEYLLTLIIRLPNELAEPEHIMDHINMEGERRMTLAFFICPYIAVPLFCHSHLYAVRATISLTFFIGQVRLWLEVWL